MGSLIEWLICMGSEILSPAIFAKGYDFFMNHAVGLTPLKFGALYSKSLINLEESIYRFRLSWQVRRRLSDLASI